ncbi:glycosyltransferase family 2 protein [Butyricicoccus faecihominis]|uniref:glycosyltransferase family 2 protein n=1 Tax=Butyricicoccus faecihominis TaxID=1712515 RepID=UPI002479DD27|nr:glycosyltransferase family 2 protein [Butyricicoccus faecihominis]MCQ5131133.1 glycosyltransferase family 2 protein [Butyricicoccus faecihominis]
MPLLTIIVPCYNEQESLPHFYSAIVDEAAKLNTAYALDAEILFINDGSQDGTLPLLRQYTVDDERIRYLSFSRNFGKEAAIFAGLEKAFGDYIVFMDADLQHPPAMLGQMYEALQTGEYDIAAARRVDRKGEPPIRSFFARLFYQMINKISKADFVDGASDYRMLTRQAANAILSMGEYNRFSKGIFGWIGFKTSWIPYENVERVAGETKWSFWGLLIYSIEGIVAFSTTPLAISSVLGILFCLVAVIGIIGVIIKTVIWGDPVAGYPTLTCLLLLIGGTLQLSLGIIGQYLAKTYLETKKRPIYIVRETEEDVK